MGGIHRVTQSHPVNEGRPGERGNKRLRKQEGKDGRTKSFGGCATIPSVFSTFFIFGLIFNTIIFSYILSSHAHILPIYPVAGVFMGIPCLSPNQRRRPAAQFFTGKHRCLRSRGRTASDLVTIPGSEKNSRRRCRAIRTGPVRSALGRYQHKP